MLQQEKVIDVRGVLERNCTTTSVDELRSQGRSRVKVINAKQISALIEEAVARAIESRRGSADTNALIEASRAEFQKLVAEREQELREVRAAMDAIEREREALRLEVAEKQALEDTVQRAREELQRVLGSPALEDLEQVLRGFTERERSEEAQRAEALTRELEEMEGQSRELAQRLEQTARERDEALRGKARAEAELVTARREPEVLRAKLLELDRQGEVTRGAEAASSEAMSAILAELRQLKDTVERAPAPAAAAPALDASKMMESLGEAMDKKLDKLGRKLGMNSGPEIAAGISFDGLFTSSANIESNLEKVEVKEREGGSIQDAVARMKAMRLKASQGES
jgi:chromosome segregation ATPase